jgi:4-hydroxy 2-oxovalerate aldolase
MKILDCTLRDGGYYTNWDFDWELVEVYLQSMNELPVDFIEIGYRSTPKVGYLGEYFYCPAYLISKIRELTDKKLAVLLNEKDVGPDDAESVLTPCIEDIDLVRIAVKPDQFLRALELGKAVKSMGFDVSFNVMYMSDWTHHPELLDKFSKLDGVIDLLYMVDSYGAVYPDQIKSLISEIRKRTSVPLGYHGHNNLELALINTLTAIDCGVDIVDGTIAGMGRGAGNLKTELLLSVLNSKGVLDFDYQPLSAILPYFTELNNQYNWGTSLPYIVAGANSIPQKQVMEWVTRRFYSLNSIIRALSNQSKGIKDNKKLPELNLSTDYSYDSALIIGGGPNAVKHSDAISEWLKRNSNTAVVHASSKNASNYKSIDRKHHFCLVGNEGLRLESVFGNLDGLDAICILPPYPRKMGTYIPKMLEKNAFELTDITFSDLYPDAHTSIALQTVLELGVDKVFLTGYDGYSSDRMTERKQELFRENEYLFANAKASGLSLYSITPTKYSGLEEASVYSMLSSNSQS